MRLNSTIEFKEFNFYILLNSSKQENTFFLNLKYCQVNTNIANLII